MSNTQFKYTPVIKRLVDRLEADAELCSLDSPDRRDGLIYDFDDQLHLTLEVALVTGRPLLLRGDPGTGKSSFAAYVARNLEWRYYEHTVTLPGQRRRIFCGALMSYGGSQTRKRERTWRIQLR